jgi:formylglycine-generating enzyme required for sulfatase activity
MDGRAITRRIRRTYPTRTAELPRRHVRRLFFAVLLVAVLAGPAAAKPLEPGDIFRDCARCPEMVVVPAGEFDMGSELGRERELPITRITIAKPLAAGRYEITFNEWDACHQAGGCEKYPYDREWGRADRPVINILHAEAEGYAAWLTKITAKTYRLPSEAEWEYAARAGSATEYWWGDEVGAGLANCRKCGTEWSGIKSAPVGSFKASPWGLFDVHGNVLEFVADCWADGLEGIPPDAAPRVTPECASHTVRGGAWYYLPKVSRSAARARNDARIFSYFIGFRVVREIADGEQMPPPVEPAFPVSPAGKTPGALSIPALERFLPESRPVPRRRIR